jgi:hypothetical protein
MAAWFKTRSIAPTPCPKTPQPVGTTTTRFEYNERTATSVPLASLSGTTQLVISGATTPPSTVVHMPPHISLLQLFRSPAPGSTFPILVANTTPDPVVLTVSDPTRTATVPPLAVAELYFRVVSADPETADVKLQVTPALGGTGCLPSPSLIHVIDDDLPMAVQMNRLMASQTAFRNDVQIVFALSPGSLASVVVANLDSSILSDDDQLSVCGTAAGQMLPVAFQSHNHTGGPLALNLSVGPGGLVTTYPPIAPLSASGNVVVTQPAGSTWRLTCYAVVAGTAPDFVGTVVKVGVEELVTG